MNIWNRCVLQIAVLLLSAAALAQSTQPTPIVPADRVITSYTLPADKMQKAKALYDVEVRLLIVDTVFGLVLLLAFLYGRVGASLRDVAESATRRYNMQGFIFVPLVLVALAIFEIPIDIYRHNLSLSYGFSIQGWSSWFGDWIKGLAIQTVFGTLVICLAYWLMRKSPRRWWFWFWLVSLPVIVFIVFIAPWVIDPMFHRFEPLEPRQPELVAEIDKVVHHGGLSIPRDRMFEMDASTKVTTVNAYVTGLGASKRVVVWDNTIQKMTTPQTLYVFGHEMGHYVLHHIWKTIAFLAVLLLIAFYLGAKLGQWAVNRHGSKWGIRNMFDWASLPLLILIIAVFSFLTQPVTNAYSRYLEHQADLYGLEVIHGIVPNPNQVAAQGFQALGEVYLSYPNPNPLLVFWTYNHPAEGDRLNFVLHYRPWEEGKPVKFVK